MRIVLLVLHDLWVYLVGLLLVVCVALYAGPAHAANAWAMTVGTNPCQLDIAGVSQ